MNPHLPQWFTARLPLAYRFIKFCLVGGSGVFVDMGILFLLAHPRTLGLNITFSKICAAELAMINNFFWNDLWTFRYSRTDTRSAGGDGQGEAVPATLGSRPSTIDKRVGLFRKFFLFNGICGIGIGLAVLLLHLFHSWFGWDLYASNLGSIVVVTFWNFAANARWNWRMK